MLSRSVFQQSYVAMMFNLAAAASYTEVTEDMRALANAAFSVVGQAKVVEDAFNRCRKNEQHGGNGTLSISDLRKYMTPVSAKVLEEAHHFETVDWRSTSAIDRGNSLVKGNLPSNMFSAPGKNMSLPLQLLVGKAPKAGWHSFSPSISIALHCDLAVEQYCHENQCFDLAPNAWLSCLLPQGKLIRRALRYGHHGPEFPWALSLGHYGNAGLMWPLEFVAPGRWKPCTTEVMPGMVKWAVVLIWTTGREWM